MPEPVLETRGLTIRFGGHVAVDGVVQTTGVTMFIASLASKQSYLRRVADAPTTTPSLAVGPGSVSVRGAF